MAAAPPLWTLRPSPSSYVPSLSSSPKAGTQLTNRHALRDTKHQSGKATKKHVMQLRIKLKRNSTLSNSPLTALLSISISVSEERDIKKQIN